MSGQRLERLGLMVKRLVEDRQLAGAVILVARKGRTVYHEAIGLADLEKSAPMEKDAVFRIASMTKLATSVGALMLYEEDRFRLNQPASEYIPELERFQVAVPRASGGFDLVKPSRKITIRDLFRHTSGISYGFGLNHVDELYSKAGPELHAGDTRHLVDRLTRLPLAWQPGTRWEYSYSTDVLGHLVEILSGQRLDAYLAERVFGPLGMEDSGFFVPPEKNHRLPSTYKLTERGLELEEAGSASRFLAPPQRASGGGGMISTASDYARLLQMILNGGELDGRRLLGRKTVELMLANHLAGIDTNWLDPGVGFGLGPAVIVDVPRLGESASPGTFFWAGIYNTYFFGDPREELLGILMTQTSPFPLHDLGTRLRTMTLQALSD